MLFADVLIVFLVRTVVQLFRSHRARSWPSVKGEVTTSQKLRSACIVVELTYTYRVDGELYTGTLEEPFASIGSAESFLSHYGPGSEITVRVKPGNSECSFVRERDLYFAAHGYRLES